MKLFCLFGLLSYGNAADCVSRTATARDCQRVCQLTPGCVLWSWWKDGGKGCYLRKQDCQLVESPRCFIVEHTTQMLSGDIHWPKHIPYQDINFNAYPEGKVYCDTDQFKNKCISLADSASDCQEICKLTTGCGSWVWRKGGNHGCYMKHRQGFEIRTNEAFVSGYPDGPQRDNILFFGEDIDCGKWT